jgi:hypothetical protein
MAGVTAIAVKVFVTVSALVPLIVPEVAVMVAVPPFTPLTKPAALTVAIVEFDVLQTAVVETSFVVLSL